MKEVSFGSNIGGDLTKCIIIDSEGSCCIKGNIPTTENKDITFKFVGAANEYYYHDTIGHYPKLL